jgi:hypothetical protein
MICDLNQPGRCAASTVAGVCIVKPTNCPVEDAAAPVCGCDGQTYQTDCHRQMAGAQLAHDGACVGDAAAADSGPDGAGTICDPPPAPGIPDGGVRCTTSCDPARPDGGVCYGLPNYAATASSIQIWVADASAPGGGWRIALPNNGAATAGGHTYQNRGDGLVGGGGNGIYGDLLVARDGQAAWTDFHFEGFASYQGNGVWDWHATLTVSQTGAASPMTIGRHYTITPVGSACTTATSYDFVAEEPPQACAFGVDLLSFVLGT